jgi:hypothetical protein
MPQTVYNATPARALAGMVVDSGMVLHHASALVEGTGVKPGLLLQRGTSPERQVKAFAAGQGTTAIVPANYLGVGMYDASREPFATGEYEAADPMTVIARGDVYGILDSGATAVAGAAVYVRTTAAGADVIGQFATGASANHALLTGAVFVTSGTGIAGVRLP